MFFFLHLVDPCQSVECAPPAVCVLDGQRRPQCLCGTPCPSDFQPVCGSDGRSYSSQCHLLQEACRTQRNLRILFNGVCQSGDFWFLLFGKKNLQWNCGGSARVHIFYRSLCKVHRSLKKCAASFVFLSTSRRNSVENVRYFFCVLSNIFEKFLPPVGRDPRFHQ